jgi:Fe-S-cluster-containing hydrogenase component 2
MSFFTIDQNRCMKDGSCAAECPMGIIAMREGHHPEPVEGVEQICINCGYFADARWVLRLIACRT